MKRALVLVAITSLSPATVHGASEAPKIAVMPVRATGALPAGWLQPIEAATAEGLGRAVTEVVPASEVAVAAARAGCDARDTTCIVRALPDGVTHVLLGAVERTGRDYVIELELVARGAKPAAAERETCAVCGLQEVAQRVSDRSAQLAAELRQEAPAAAPITAPAVLEIRSAPPGATIIIDGSHVGESPRVHAVPPGQHVIEGRMPGWRVAQRRVEVASGATISVALELTRIPPPKRFDRRLGAGLLGPGLLGVVAGVVLLTLDERPIAWDCSGANLDVLGQCRFRYDTLTGGAVALSLGTVAAIAGAVVLGVAGKRRATAAIRTRIGPGRVALGVRF